MRLKQYINELSMKKGTKIKFERDMNHLVLVEVVLEDDETFFIEFRREYVEDIFEIINKHDESIIARAEKKGLVEYTQIKGTGSIAAWEIMFEDSAGEYGISSKRKGAAIELFAAIEQVTKRFIKSKKPEILVFTSDIGEQSRVKLYKLLAKKIKTGGYKEIQTNERGYSFFIFYNI